MHDTLTMEIFSPLVNEEFNVYIGDTALSARLLEVTPLRASRDDPDHQAWSLVFQFPPQQLFDQGTYEFEHADTGRMAVFVVPIGQDENGVRYQAIFN